MQTAPTITTDSKVGRWRVLRIAHRRALCRCRCGGTHEVSFAALQSGDSLSCGCSALSLKNNTRDRVVRLPDWRPGR